MKDKIEISMPDKELKEKALKVRKAATKICHTSNDQRRDALNKMADSLVHYSDRILEANEHDFNVAKKKGISQALLSRLKLSKDKLLHGIEGVRKVRDSQILLGRCKLIKSLHQA